MGTYHSRDEEASDLDLGHIKPLRSIPVENLPQSSMLIGKAPLPVVLRGLFWLTHQENSSCVASFGGPNGDGSHCSNGYLDERNTCMIRVMGDRVWGYGAAAYDDNLELVYEFTFNNATHPTKAQIHPIANQEGMHEDFEASGVFSSGPMLGMMAPFSHHWMELEGDDHEYPNSVIWQRKSGFLCMPFYHYKLVQVLDECARPIQPAFGKLVDYMKWGDGKDSQGLIYYHSD